MIAAGIACGIAGGMLLIISLYAMELEWTLSEARRNRKQRRDRIASSLGNQRRFHCEF